LFQICLSARIKHLNHPLIPTCNTAGVINVLRKHWPTLLAVLMFIGISTLVQMNIDSLLVMFEAVSPLIGVLLFLFVGIGISLIPSASTLPLIPLAVTLWGWPVAALLILLVWTIGGQILFLTVRFLGKPRVTKMIPSKNINAIGGFVEGKGVFSSMLVRFVVDGDILSYAFALFSNIKSWRYFGMSLVSSIPAALMYAYVGNTSFWLQIALMVMVFALFVVHKMFKERVDLSQLFQWPATDFIEV